MASLLINGKYLGLNPDSFALASYACETCGAAFSSNQGVMIFCPNCAKVATKVNSKVEASSIDATEIATCKSCASGLYSDLEPEVLANGTDLFCPECGDAVSIQAEGDEEGDDEEKDDAADTAGGDDEDNNDDSDDSDDDSDDDDSEEAEAMVVSAKTLLGQPLPSREMVAMDLWHTGEDSIRNVIVAGIPIARIHLSDQANDEIQKVFSEESYVEAMTEAMIINPLKQVLASANARIFTLAETNAVPTEKQVATSVTEKMNNYREKFKETFLAVLSGVNKNLFPDVENQLKKSLWEALSEVGIEQPHAIIEPVFQDQGEQFLDDVFDKTMELMDKGDDVRAEVIKMTVEAGAMTVNNDRDTELESKLVQSSFPLHITSQATNVGNLKNRIQLGRR